MTLIGFHASHEQLPPSVLLDAVRFAEEAGFEAAMSSDHFAPWSSKQGESGFAWAWLGAAMNATRLPFGVVNARRGSAITPRSSPRRAASLGELFPGRLWVTLGSGEASNEHITGDRWPDKPARNARLLESAGVIRALLSGEEVSVNGHVRVDRARLWTLPVEAPPLIGAALGTETAAWLGGWADGLVTVQQPVDRLRAVIDAFPRAWRRRRTRVRPGAPVMGNTRGRRARDRSRAVAHQRVPLGVDGRPGAGRAVRDRGVDRAARGCRRGGAHLRGRRPRRVVAGIADLGVDGLYLHHVGKEQRRFIETFAEKVLPEVRG